MLQLALAIWGGIVLYTGKLKVSSNKQVEGTAARLLGLLMLAPFPLGFMIGMGVGIWATTNGQPIEELQIPLILIDVGLVVGTAIIVFAVGLAIGKPPADKVLPPPWPPNYSPPGYPPTFPPPPPGPPADPNNPYHPPRM